jgi:hypothetical protein
MKRRTLLAGAGATLTVVACVPMTVVAAHPDATPLPPDDLEPFYEALDPHGDWWWNEHWGWVWSPTVGPGWRPYTRGTWMWTTDEGWLWASSEPFGWAVFHYGRWVWLDDAGWVWVPGRVWGPAWVVWRQGPGFVGWAPLHPEVAWVPGRGFVRVDLDYGVVSGAWVFVDDRYVVAPDVSVVCWPAPRNVVVLSTSTIIHRPARDHAEHRNDGVDIDVVSRARGQQVRPHRIIHTDDPSARPAARDDDDDDNDSGDNDDARRAEPRAIVVPSPRAIARPRLNEPDVLGPRARLQREVEQRPLPTPRAEDVDRHWDEVRRRVIQDHERERRAAPAGISPDVLGRRQRAELEELEREKQRERQTDAKKGATPRKVTRKATRKVPHKGSPPPGSR